MIAVFAFAALAQDPYAWRLAGLYDGTAVAHLGAVPPDYAWRPHDGMTESCGPAKSPDGLGVFEAEAVSSRLTPALFVVLERNGGDPLGPNDLRVALGTAGPEVLLHPMVEPRHLEIHVRGDPGTERIVELVRTQLETETCMEHKTGRAWTGHDAARVRQAFLLDPPVGADPSRKYFGGQQDPVPALIGPPDACMRLDDQATRPLPTGRGEGSLTLVPTDVWGASNRRCRSNETAGAVLSERSRWLPLRSSAESGPWPDPSHRWSGLDVTVTLAPGAASEEEGARVTLQWEGEQLLANAPLFTPTETVPGLVDLLARVPHRYPTVAGGGDAGRYTVLIVPAWQIVEALRRIERSSPQAAMQTSPPGLADGVAHVLANPDLLYVQLAPVDPNATEWPNLSGNLESRLFREPWGYTVGMDGRGHVITAGRVAPTWNQAVEAQRGVVHAAMLAGFLVLFGVSLAGARRIPDLFNPLPEERAHYWPGLQADAEGEPTAPTAPTEGES